MRNIQDYTEKYIHKAFEDVMVKIRKKIVVEQCKRYSHINIVEIGCGMEPLFMEFDDFKHMVIIEPSELFVSNARQMAEERGVTDRVMIINDFVENVDYRSVISQGKISLVLVSSLLHEVDEPQKLLNQVNKLCSEDTIVHINVPNAKSLHRLIAVASGMITDEHDRSQEQVIMQSSRTYDIELLREEVSKAGFYVIDQGSYFLKPFTHKQMKQCLDAEIIDGTVLKGLEKGIKFLPDYGAEIYVNVRKVLKESQ